MSTSTDVRITDFKVPSFGCYGTLIDRESGIWNALEPLLARGRIARVIHARLSQLREFPSVAGASSSQPLRISGTQETSSRVYG